MTLALPGFTAKLLVSALSGTPKEVAEARELTVDIEHELIDATSHDSAEFREMIRGLRNWSITAGILHITGDTEQALIRANILAGLAMDIELTEETGAGKPVWSGSVFVASTSLSFPNDDAMTSDVTLTGTSVLVEGVQS